jgi:2-succinyl-5-enolpyruvyl-6-hydroxy-3-cyclohexene-1-carboxylate synthase
MSTEADVALTCMTAFVDGLVEGGMRSACVSPGSRSTPLALALARHPGVRIFVHLDERSSAFFAVGLAKASGEPVAVACTSGTAAANLLPAVVEASMARVPVIVLTADRPPELRGVGANQTIDQRGLYGGYARAFTEAPVPGDDPGVAGWRRRGAAAARSALALPPRPVHVNLPFREPLVPEDAGTVGPAPNDEPGAIGHAASADGAVSHRDGSVDATASAPERELSPFAERLPGTARGVVYAGGLRRGGEDVVAVARALGWPLVAEPHSGARRPDALAAGQLLLANERFVDEHVPDVVLQIGAAPTSRAALSLVGRTPALLIVDPDDVVADPLRRSLARLVAPPALLLDLLPSDARPDEAWRSAWRSASHRARSAVDALLDRWEEPFEGRVARDVAACVADGSVVCAGSSMPVRDLDTFMRPRADLRVVANRGASGIDGFVSTTLGVAAAGAPTVALLGDLTLLHDVGALVWNARRGANAVFVVPNNGGGRIFSLLEQRALPELDALFTTPHHADLGAVATAAGARHVRVERAADLAEAVRGATNAGGVWVVEVVLDAARDRARRAEVGRAVEEALS